MVFARGMTGPLYGPKLNSSDAQRQQLFAQQLLREGARTDPVQGGWGEALARIGTAGIGGYLANQAGETEKAYKADRAQTLAKALMMGQDQPPPAAPTLAGGEAAATRGTGVAQQGTKGDPMKVAQMLMANPSTADIGAQLALGQMHFAQQRGAQKEDAAASQAFQKEMAGIQQAFQTGQLNAQQAFAAQQAAQQRAHAAGLQTNQQQFLTNQAASQQTFQGQQNQLNRDAQAAQQQAAAALAKVPQGYQVSPQGGVVPIPGSPQATEAADIAKTKAEQLVATDKMLRSIDDLIGAPAPAGSDPELIKARKDQASAREQGTGLSSYLNWVPGTAGRDFEANLDALKSQAFLPMVAQLKGMGALSDAEGKKLTQAIGALDSSMSEGAFLKSLNQIKADLTEARTRMSGGTPPPSAAPSSSLPPLPPGFNQLP